MLIMGISLLSFIKHFNSEIKCLDYLVQLKYGLSFKCTKCNSNKIKQLKSRFATLYCSECKKQFSVAKDTIFESSKISLLQWFIAAYLMSKDKRGISALQLTRELDITYNSAFLLLTKFRNLMQRREETYKLSGEIDIDEFFILGSGGKAGRGSGKAKVLIALSYDYQDSNTYIGDIDDAESFDEFEETITPGELRIYPAYIKMKVVENLDASTINTFVTDNIVSGSRIRTDGFRGYNKLLETDNERIIENSDKEMDNYRKLNLIITNIKAYINGTYHGVTKNNLQIYLDEFCYRFNRRKMHESLFDRLLKLALEK